MTQAQSYFSGAPELNVAPIDRPVTERLGACSSRKVQLVFGVQVKPRGCVRTPRDYAVDGPRAATGCLQCVA